MELTARIDRLEEAVELLAAAAANATSIRYGFIAFCRPPAPGDER